MVETEAQVGVISVVTDLSVGADGGQSAEHLSCLQRLSLALINALTVEEVVDAFITAGLSAFPAVPGVICLFTGDSAQLEVVRTFGPPPHIARLHDRFTLDAPVPMAVAGGQQRLILVAKVQERVVGAIGFAFTDHSLFSPADRACVETMAQMFALAVERAKRYDLERLAREVAEQKLEQKVRQSNEDTRDFFGSLTDGFIAYNQQWRVMFANDVAADFVRLPHEALMGKVIWDLFPEIVGSPYYEACHRAINERIPVHRDDFWPRFNVWIEHHIFPVNDGIAIMFRDITETRRAEEALRAAETQLRLITDASPVLITYIDAQERFCFVNRAYADWLGASVEQIVGKTIQELVKPAVYETIEHYIHQALSGQTVSYERTAVDGAGRMRHTYATYVPDFNPDGAVRGFVGVGTDITERKQLEMRLREETESLETINRLGQRLSAELDLEKLVQAATDGAIRLTGAQFGAFCYNVADPDGVDAAGENYALDTISGVPRETFSRFPMSPDTALFAPTFAGEGTIRLDDVTRDPRYGRPALYQEKPHQKKPQDKPCQEKSPEHLPVVSYLAVPVVSRSGMVLGGLFFGHEQPCMFTERHERIVEGVAAQAAIAIDNARLFQAERERSHQLGLAISEVHHRVKNSLQAVAALLEMQIPPNESVMPVEAARDSLSQIKTIALVHDLLAQDKPIGMVDTARVLTNLAGLLAQGMRMDGRPLPIYVNAEPIEMPTKSATSLALVVNELLTNAAKHNVNPNAGDPADPGAIEVSLTCKGENVIVGVRDHGPGFSADFDPARHAHIGLELVQTLVSHDLRGRITFGNAISADGAHTEGARIEISFPKNSFIE